MKAISLARALRAAALAGTLGACGPATAPPPARVPSDPDVITRAEIAASGATNVYDVVVRLRPGWLAARGIRNIGGTTGLAAYENQVRLESVDALRQLSANYAWSLRYLDGSTASNTLPGIQPREHVTGAIIVNTRPEPGEEDRPPPGAVR